MSPDTPRKRKADPKPSAPPTKRSRSDREGEGEGEDLPPPPNPPKNALVGPHEAIIADLSARNDVLAASVISSSRIGKRTAYITAHLLRPSGPHPPSSATDAGDAENAGDAERPRLALLYARAADACKMITVAELCKRTLGEAGRRWFQYNQMFELPGDELAREDGRRERRRLPRRRRGERVQEAEGEEAKEVEIEEDGDGDGDSDDDDAFEPLPSRFESAVLPPPRARTTRSLRIFLALEPIADLRSRPDVTVQSSEETGGTMHDASA